MAPYNTAFNPAFFIYSSIYTRVVRVSEYVSDEGGSIHIIQVGRFLFVSSAASCSIVCAVYTYVTIDHMERHAEGWWVFCAVVLLSTGSQDHLCCGSAKLLPHDGDLSVAYNKQRNRKSIV